MLRKILAMVLVITLTVTLSSISFASQSNNIHSINEATIKSIVKDIKATEAENLTFEELQYAATVANTDKRKQNFHLAKRQCTLRHIM